MFELTFKVETSDYSKIDSYFEDEAYSVWFKCLDGKDEAQGDMLVTVFGLWHVRVLLDNSLDTKIICQDLENMGYTVLDIKIEEVKEKDWLLENLESFPPFACGVFYIYPNHVKGEVPVGKIPLLMDSSSAFGTGRHETTSMIIEALSDIKESFSPKTALDMGSGSGILSIATSKLFNINVLGVDIDERSVVIAKEYAVLNNANCDFLVGNGYKAVNSTYDLIVSNILATPICDMSLDCYNHANSGALVVLSGFLIADTDRVLNTYIKSGFKYFKTIQKGDWVALLLHKII